MKRRDDWQKRLRVAVDDAISLPFAYGVHDCCLWTAHCVDVMCDTSIAREIKERFNYADEASANEVLDAGGGLLPLVTDLLGIEHERATYAAPGDVVVAKNGDGRAIIGICYGHNIVAPGPDGLISLPYGNGIVCWKV